MQRFKSFAERYPLLFSLIVFLVLPLLVTALIAGGGYLLLGEYDAMRFFNPTRLVIFGVYLLIAWRFGWLRSFGLQSAGRWQTWLVMAGVLAASVIADVYILTGGTRMQLSPLGLGALGLYMLAAWRFGWLEDGFKSGGRWRPWLVLGALLVLSALPSGLVLRSSTGLQIAPGTPVGEILIKEAITGLFEETAFRGLILVLFLQVWGRENGNVWKAILVSSVLFGLWHYLGMLGNGSFSMVSLQVLGASLSGVFLAALMLHGKSLWIPIAAHALENGLVYLFAYQETFGATLADGAGLALVSLAQAVIALVLLYRWQSQPERQTLAAQAA